MTVNAVAFGLKIRSKWPAFVRTLVPFQPEPQQAIINNLDSSFLFTAFVGVLNPQDERPAVMASKKPVEERSPRTAYV